MKKFFALSAELLYDCAGSYFVLFVLSAVSVYLISSSLAGIFYFYDGLDATDKATKNEGIVLDATFSLTDNTNTDEYYRELAGKIAQISGVSSVSRYNAVGISTYSITGEQISDTVPEIRFETFYCTEELYKLFELDIIEGRNIEYPSESGMREIVVSEALSGVFSVGDVIVSSKFAVENLIYTEHNAIYEECGEDLDEYKKQLEQRYSEKLLVVGIASDNSKLLKFNARYSNYNILLSPWTDAFVVYGGGYSGGCRTEYYCTLKPDADTDAVIAELSAYGEAYEIREFYDRRYSEVMRSTKEKLPSVLISVMACLGCVLVCTVVNIYRNLRRYKVFRICGASLGRCAALVTFINASVLMAALCIGMVYTLRLKNMRMYMLMEKPITSYVYPWVIIIFAVILAVSTVLPFLLLKKDNIVGDKE